MKNLGHISHEYDVVTKKYVDNKVSEAEIGYIEKSYSGSDITFSDEELEILKKPGSYIGLIINNEIKYFNRNTQSTATEIQAIQFVSEPDAPSEDIRTQLTIIINYSTKTGTVITSVEELAIQSDWLQTNTNSLDYIKNKPSIPTKVSDLSDGSLYVTKEYVDNINISEYSIIENDATGDYSKTYSLTKDGVEIGTKINIPKDLVINSGSVKEVTTTDIPYLGAVIGDKYLDIELNDSTKNHIYIPVKELVDIYLAGDGISISNNNTISSNNSNLVNGSSTGSLKSINATEPEGKKLGINAIAIGAHAFATGENSVTINNGRYDSIASGQDSFIVGYSNTVSSKGGIAIGDSNTVEGECAIALTSSGWAKGPYSLVCGMNVETGENGEWAHAEGSGTLANNEGAHAEGSNSKALGLYSHAEGADTRVDTNAEYSHSEGVSTIVKGSYSHAEGVCTLASSNIQHVSGKANIEDTLNKYVEIVGNGEVTIGNYGATTVSQSNARTLDWSGNAWYAGTIKVGGTGQDDTNAKELATKEYVNNTLSDLSITLVDKQPIEAIVV